MFLDKVKKRTSKTTTKKIKNKKRKHKNFIDIIKE